MEPAVDAAATFLLYCSTSSRACESAAGFGLSVCIADASSMILSPRKISLTNQSLGFCLLRLLFGNFILNVYFSIRCVTSGIPVTGIPPDEPPPAWFPVLPPKVIEPFMPSRVACGNGNLSLPLYCDITFLIHCGYSLVVAAPLEGTCIQIFTKQFVSDDFGFHL